MYEDWDKKHLIKEKQVYQEQIKHYPGTDRAKTAKAQIRLINKALNVIAGGSNA